MLRIAISLLLIFLSSCATSEQADYGWVAKPKLAIIEKYNTKTKLFDTVAYRQYYSTDGVLDSIVDQIQNSRSVYNRFSHSDNTYRIIPWDYSLTANFTQAYTRDSTNNWRLVSEREDSVHNGYVVSTEYRHHDSLGVWKPMIRSWEEYDAEGYKTAELRCNDIGTVTGKRFFYDRNRSGKVFRMTQIGQSDTSWFKGTQLFDTNSYSSYRYDDNGVLVEMVDSTVLEWYDSYSFVMRYSEFEYFDTVAWFSRQVIPHVHGAFPKRQMMKRGLLTVRTREGENKNRFSATLDDRYRLISLETNSSRTRANYYEDNSLREKLIYDVNGALTEHERTLRIYDDQRRVLMQERQSYDSKLKLYQTTSRSYYSY